MLDMLSFRENLLGSKILSCISKKWVIAWLKLSVLPAAPAAAWATVPAGHWSGGMVCGVSVVVWDTWTHGVM